VRRGDAMHPPTTSDALLVIAIFSRHDAALDWARLQLESAFGSVALETPRFAFGHTRYYEKSMGADLHKQLLAFERLMPLANLADVKIRTNAMEHQLAESGTFAESRPLNLDPGLLNLGKFMLATTKDKDHRLYLRDGIFAEVTLRYCDGQYLPWPWTYADYCEEFVREFLDRSRTYYKSRMDR